MLFYDQQTKDRIRKLRSAGYTYKEIELRIGFSIPKGSMSYICRDIKLDPKAIERLAHKYRVSWDKSRRLAVIANHNIRQKMLEDIREKNKAFRNLSDREVKIALVFLYLGEGAKWPSHSGMTLGSSDPRIVRIYIELLKRCYSIDIENMRGKIAYRYDQDIIELKEYWSKVTGIPIGHFYNSIPDPRTKNRPTKKTGYKGVCSIYCAGSKNQLELDIIADIIDGTLTGL